jgi:adenine deaminase
VHWSEFERGGHFPAIEAPDLLVVDAGIPPWGVLRAATLGAAEYLGEDDRFGTVREGKQAELVMLRGNPLEDIRHTAEIEAVYSRGRLINTAELESMRTAACDALNDGAG